jgi:hypothetical protein
MKIKKKREKKKKREDLKYEQDRTDGSAPRPEEKWIGNVNAPGPSNPHKIPSGLTGISADPESTIAWIEKNCKFAQVNNENSD